MTYYKVPPAVDPLPFRLNQNLEYRIHLQNTQVLHQQLKQVPVLPCKNNMGRPGLFFLFFLHPLQQTEHSRHHPNLAVLSSSRNHRNLTPDLRHSRCGRLRRSDGHLHLRRSQRRRRRRRYFAGRRNPVKIHKSNHMPRTPCRDYGYND